MNYTQTFNISWPESYKTSIDGCYNKAHITVDTNWGVKNFIILALCKITPCKKPVLPCIKLHYMAIPGVKDVK